MTIDEELSKLETEYYQISHRIFFEPCSNKWMGKVRVYRKDTLEVVDAGFRVVDQEKNMVIKKMFSKIESSFKQEVKALDIPFEWDSPVRPVLVDSLKFTSFISKFYQIFEKNKDGKITDEEFTSEFVFFWNQLIVKTIDLSRNIEGLTKKERIELLTSSDNVINNPGDFWNLDDLSARSRVFKFFLNPSQKEVDAHEIQLFRMKNKFHELGWDKEDE